MRDRACFTAHWVICLAIAAGAYFAYRAGIPQMVAANDVARWFGGAIGALFLAMAIYLGFEAWGTDNLVQMIEGMNYGDKQLAWKIIERRQLDASLGHLMELIFPAIGMLGTVVGLSLAFRNAGTPEMMAGAATAFLSTGCGITAMILTMVLTANLEAGIRRARR